jgi:aryl-alcohol dehydrogenase-like predicted oxidoreductase
MSDSLVDPTERAIGMSLRCGPIGFGCWRFTHERTADARRVLEAALDTGMEFVDTADVYGLDWGGSGFGTVEERLGDVLRAAPGLRDRMVLATKGGIRPPVPYDSSPTALRSACEASLRRLGVDHIDLYQVHRADLFTHPHDVADALAALVAEGKVREVGVSNHTPAQHEALAAALAERGVRLATTQVEYSALHLAPLRDGTLDLAMRTGLAVLAWSPLAGGRLGEHSDGLPDGVPRDLLAVLDDLAVRHGTDRATVALAFALAHPARPVVLVGSQDPARLAAAKAALAVPLTRTDAYRIVAASEGRPLP